MHLQAEKLIDYGGFGRVYVAKVLSSDLSIKARTVALKKSHITKHVLNPMLRHEACALMILEGHPSIPTVYAWGRSQYFEYLALELLGETVASGTLGKFQKLTMRNLVALVCQMIDVIEYVHSYHFIHGDIKPGNFCFGVGESKMGRIYLIDYGLSKFYRDPLTLQHVREHSMPFLRGTRGYASLNMHLHRVPSRRDDMESLSYTIIKLLRGSLPWNDEEPEDHFRVKNAWSGSLLCAGYPAVFGQFVDYTRGLSFSATPDYSRWKHEFRTLVPGLPEDPLFDGSDRQGPYVGVPGLEAQPNSFRSSVDEPTSEDADSLPYDDDHFCPTSSWPEPTPIKDADLFGDEGWMIREKLESITEPPAMYERYLRNSKQTERMVL